jgi:hypothetical protein
MPTLNWIHKGVAIDHIRVQYQTCKQLKYAEGQFPSFVYYVQSAIESPYNLASRQLII